MNKQELQNEITKTKEHLANMEKMLAECEYERWKPEYDKHYWFINSLGQAEITRNIGLIFHKLTAEYYNCFGLLFGLETVIIFCCEFVKYYNCFQTEEQAKTEAEKILVRRMLEDIARRLNKGEKIDWKNSTQYKYSFYLDNKINKIDWCLDCRCTVQGSVYCLDINFYKVAIQEIGEERLKKYLRGE